VSTYGWEATTPDIIAAGLSARRAPTFDPSTLASDAARQVAEARRFSWWPLALAIFAFVLPNGWIWASIAFVWWMVGIMRGNARGRALAERLAQESVRRVQLADAEAAQLQAILTGADAGDGACLQALLERWNRLRPPAIESVTFRLRQEASLGMPKRWALIGEALQRDAIQDSVTRPSRGRRTATSKRKATEIDEDLAQLNAAAALSVATALFSGSRRQRVDVALLLRPTPPDAPMPWVTFAGDLNETTLLGPMRAQASPVDVVRALGGDVGRCRALRYTPARTAGSLVEAPRSLATEAHRGVVSPSAVTPPAPRARNGDVSSGIIRGKNMASPAADDPYGARSAAVDFGAGATPGPAASIPQPPPGRVSLVQTVAGEPTTSAVRGLRFSTAARKYVDFPGDPSARFVAFQHYWATYTDMAPGQLKFYFKWRGAARRGEVIRTDLSYIFVHVYELLHVIGAADATDAAQQMERLWTAYRATFPQLDTYIVQWTADLLATEVGQPAALAWIERAVAAGASARGPELMLVLDRYWIAGDYASMPAPCVATLAGDPRLGDNKFYQQHNTTPDTQGWVDRAYREALVVTDRATVATDGRAPRELAIAKDGYMVVSRDAFGGAIYDFKRKPAVLGKVPALPEGSAVIGTYRNAVRYAENLLRKERGFSAKLRGVDVPPVLAAALDAHFVGYIRATKPRTRVTINLDRARDLTRDSADVRARLLAGLEDAETPLVTDNAPLEQRTAAEPVSASAPADVPAGLLTDLQAIQAAIIGLSSPARAVLDALHTCGWEASPADPALLAAAGGALVGPLIDEINERVVDAVGDVLVVHEDTLLVIQEDFRDEVYWVLRGTLDGFGALPTTASQGAVGAAAMPRPGVDVPPIPAVATREAPSTDGFGPLDLRVLSIVTGPPSDAAALLGTLARENGLTPLLLLDRVNEVALESPFGDLVIDVDASPPAVHEDAQEYVAELLSRVTSIVPPPRLANSGESAITLDPSIASA
jgi:TerB N-terminal domain/TerB-C domain